VREIVCEYLCVTGHVKGRVRECCRVRVLVYLYVCVSVFVLQAKV
jgi:hypothetical protein